MILMPLSSSGLASAAAWLRQEPPVMRLVLEQERQRIHIHRGHDLIEMEAETVVKPIVPLRMLCTFDSVAELRIVITSTLIVPFVRGPTSLRNTFRCSWMDVRSVECRNIW